MRGSIASVLLACMLALLATGCDNNPWHRDAAASNTLFSAAIESSPRHLDPTASYWSNDTPFTYQVYEPPYGYHYLKRPFQLVPKTAREVVKPYYIGKDGQRLPDDAPA
ncbi:MAG TPA: peptide ABC transporter substrate-binding protein, partial [Rubrivivax sp.]|nr:peptide ABC transporter substrate-binding protein [Rubrivivax sp.]